MDVVIVGAGLAGLTLARRLCREGVRAVLVEREDAVGGLARSFSYANGATFDIGPHRFHTEDPAVLAFVNEVLGDNSLRIRRNSELFLFDQYLPWPLNWKSVLALPPQFLAAAACDLLRPRKARTESLEDYIVEKYGRTLYKIFFQPYTERFLDYECANLHRDWAITGIDRATIDRRFDSSSIGGVIRSTLFPPAGTTEFIYPETGGIGSFAELLAADILRHGGRILLSDEPERFLTAGGAVTGVVTRQGAEIPADHVFWTGNLQSLRTLGDAPEAVPRLHFISTVLFNYVTGHRAGRDFQWCYFGERDMKISRICLPRNFSPSNTPAGREALCVEMSCPEGSSLWRDPARWDCVVETFLLKARLLDSLDSVDSYHVEWIRDTYPVYVLNYRRKLQGMLDWVHGKWPNLSMLGRTARFWYNNMDHSIAASLRAADLFLEDHRAGRHRDGGHYEAEDRFFKGTAP
ncbi:MAG TPA: FAD-dependent oxidoreductase [Candidatus Hydrogenedentes bacterium]|nr:FAD-dependent oxidoreductase [Candidatus Hydrogenedentota bacterium]HOC71434.1 FAD-dependent oxidoreductase [Candidatus Hydrogenedentota bacterium]HRZ81750.1 FAD-dependent oxidoreductase [Candidatus Hydrogenedentota bacterium]